MSNDSEFHFDVNNLTEHDRQTVIFLSRHARCLDKTMQTVDDIG